MSPKMNVLIITAVFLLGACSPGGLTAETSTPRGPAPSSPGGGGQAPGGEPHQEIDWSDSSIIAEFDGGWTMHACEGDAPFLCVERAGEPMGTVEALWYPQESFDVIDPNANTDENLRALADDFLSALTADRSAGCGPDYEMNPIEPVPFSIGGHGLAYGYEGMMADGSPSELNLHYTTIVNETILSIVVAAYDEGGCPGRDDTSGFDTASLKEFRRHLESALIDSPLPDVFAP